MKNTSIIPLLILRLMLGWVFFYAGYSKVITYFTDAKDWSAAGFLTKLDGPFAFIFSNLANNIFVDYLNAYGLLFVGIALLLGIFLRWSCFWGIILMILYYLAGYPPKNAMIVDQHLVYIAVLILIAGSGAGRIWGLDKYLEETVFIKSNRWLLKILG